VHKFAKQSGPVRRVNPIGGILPVLAAFGRPWNLSNGINLRTETATRLVRMECGHTLVCRAFHKPGAFVTLAYLIVGVAALIVGVAALQLALFQDVWIIDLFPPASIAVLALNLGFLLSCST
jgi:hypothetical protein